VGLIWTPKSAEGWGMQISDPSGAQVAARYSTAVEKLEQHEARSLGEAEADLIEDAGEVTKSNSKAKNADGVGRRLDLRA